MSVRRCFYCRRLNGACEECRTGAELAVRHAQGAYRYGHKKARNVISFAPDGYEFVADAAKRNGVSCNVIQRMLQAGKVPYIRNGHYYCVKKGLNIQTAHENGSNRYHVIPA